MKNYYIADINAASGIGKYSNDFYRLVLKPKGYIYINSNQPVSDILSEISSLDTVHLELGIFQKQEIELLFRMTNSNYKNVSVTLHDAPLVKYPFREFRIPMLNQFSKLFDIWGNFRSALPTLKKLQAIYVLSYKALAAMSAKYNLTNVHYLPHIIDVNNIESDALDNKNLLYFGFIGKNKGIEYALKLHEKLLNQHPDVNFFVVGTALGKQASFLDYLKSRYKKNVFYLGYVPSGELEKVFNNASFAMILFKDYKFYWPFSGSILYSLKKGKIIITNKVNAIDELVENEKTGFFISGNLGEDVKRMTNIFLDKERLKGIQRNAKETISSKYCANKVAEHLLKL